MDNKKTAAGWQKMDVSKADTAEMIVVLHKRGYHVLEEKEYKEERKVLRKYAPGRFEGT
jgi:hypothetical protein